MSRRSLRHFTCDAVNLCSARSSSPSIGLMQSELHLVVVMLLSLTVTMFVESFRKHNLRETMDDVQAFFDDGQRSLPTW